MGEDKDMKKIISILILLLSLTGLYALNPPAWMMGYWFEKDDSHVVNCGILKITPDNVIVGKYDIFGPVDYYLDVNGNIDFYDAECIEEYDDDSYMITLKYKSTGEVIDKLSFSHDTIDNKVIFYAWNNGEWLFGRPYGRTKPVNIPESDL